VKEVLLWLIDAWKNYPDKIAATFMLEIIGKEYAAISE